MPSYIVKADPDQDWYVIWSTIVDAPCQWGTRAELERMTYDRREVAPERFARADKNGTSANWPNWPEDDMPFGWNDAEFLLMESSPERPNGDGFWLLPRKNLRAFCEALDAEHDTTPLLVWTSHAMPTCCWRSPTHPPPAASRAPRRTKARPPMPETTCTCGTDATSLNPAEVVVHCTDGPCYIAPAAHLTTADQADGEVAQ